jgi:hypothetical protein
LIQHIHLTYNIQNFNLLWGDLVPSDVSHFNRQETFVPELQYQTLECDPSPDLSPLAAVASMWNATSGVSETEAVLQSTWMQTTSPSQDPDELYEILARFALEREVELGTSSDQISASTETRDTSKSDHWKIMSKQATEEIPGTYDLEHEHAQHAFNVPGLNEMQIYRNDSDMYPSDGSWFLAQTETVS